MNKEYTNDKDDAVSQSVNITLNALKHGPVQLAAVFADLLQQNSNLIKKNELLEKMVESSKHIHDDEKLDNVFTQHLHEEHPNLEQDFHSNDIITEKNGNVKSRELHTNNVCNKLKDLHSSLNLQATFKNENHLKHQTLCRSSQSIEIPEKKEKVGYLSKTMVPHPLFGCYCDVCQKLLLNPNVEVYKLEARDGHLISRNCLVVLKEDLLATVLYVGHRRCYKGFVNERFCKEERPLGVTVNISGLDKEAFISLKDIEYLLEFKPPIPTLKREPKFPPRKDHLNCNLNRREGNRNCNSKPDSLNIIPSCVVDEDTTDGKEHLRSCFHRPTYLHSEKRLPSNSTVREKRPLFQHTLTLGDREGVLCRQCHSASDLYEKRQTEGKESRCYWPKSGDHLFQRRSSTPSQEEMLKRLSSCIDSNHVSGRRKSDTIDSTTSLGFDESFTFGLCKYNEIAAHSPSINSGKCFDALKRQVRSALYSEEPSICCQHALPRYRSNNQHCY